MRIRLLLLVHRDIARGVKRVKAREPFDRANQSD
jgi:hypothetical protein